MRRHGRAAALAAALGAAAAGPGALAAQTSPVTVPAPPTATVTREEECLGFAFGRWTPALDARAAGHHPFPPSGALPQAPNGRDWASAIGAGRDTTLMLFPAWWPAGVHIRVPGNARVRVGDTLRTTAVALVADGRVQPPTARALVWLVPCGGPRRSAPAAPAAPAGDTSATPGSAAGGAAAVGKPTTGRPTTDKAAGRRTRPPARPRRP